MSDLASSALTELERESPEDAALLHLLDGYYIKRHTVKPWNTRGGYCDVYKGDHPKFGKVAMKRPRGDQCTESQIRNFRREAQIWKDLRHPNILLFVGMIDRQSHVWLISVFAENGSLHEYTREHQEADRQSLVFQLTSGLEYLHSQNVIHGDLKSDNLLISSNHQLLIADFGLSKLRGSATDTSKKGAGSVRWMAPELFEEDATKTLLTDVYAYGITISEILCGALPFNRYSTGAVIAAVLQNKRPPTKPKASPQGKSYATLWFAAEACWSPEPSKRPSMTDVCIQFSLEYRGGPKDAIREGRSSQNSGLGEAAIIHSETTPFVESIDSNPQPVNPTTLVNDAGINRLLQLLGGAEHGGIGHMKGDGLCLEGTRIDVLQKLDAWADGSSSPTVTLLKGQAGRGKSTIARSVSSRFRNRWGGVASSAIFHFRRNNEALNSRPLCALARQLACNSDPRVRAAVLKSVQDHEEVAELRLEEQFEILLLQPLKSLGSNSPRILLVIDALDECSDLSLISSLLRLIREHSSSLPSTVRLLLTTRPEDHIVRQFNVSFGGVQEDLDTIDEAIVDHDIRSYFAARLSEIQRDFGFDTGWVSPGDISELVRRTQGLFQWAHAAVEYIRERPQSNLRRLVRSPTLVLGLPSLYQQILSTAFPRRKDVEDDENLVALIQHVIGSLVVAHRPMSPAILEYLWDCDPDCSEFSDADVEIRDDVLGRLGSILVLPSSPDGPIHFMHASVRDFFTNPAQCEDTRFPVTPTVHHRRLSAICFRRMERDLKNSIGVFDDPSKMNSEVLHLVKQHILAGLRYCCRSWSAHLLETKDDENAAFKCVREHLDEFCSERVLLWLEVLSLIGALSEVFDMLRRAREWLKKLKAPQSQAGTQTTDLLGDTDDFCRRFFKPMSANAHHIPLSFLFHFPNETTLRSLYATGRQTPRIIRGPVPRFAHSRGIGTGQRVFSVAFSPDGKTVASGSADCKIRLWDADTGELKGNPFVGHKNWVKSIAFAPDGKTLASGSNDKHVRLWDVDTREPKKNPLVGHTDYITSVSFSPNGQILASGSEDNTIRLWDVRTGKPTGKPLVGHTDWVTSVAFTPDSKILASGSDDKQIRLWDMDAGEPKGMPLVGHTGSITCVAFSPDGKTLVSGSTNKQIRLWNIITGELKGEPLVGHHDSITSLALAPDGKTLVSGSKDNTIRPWDCDTGKPKGSPLVGHNNWVSSVAFAPDGKTLASGSSDGQIRLWVMDTQEPERNLLFGHTNSVKAVLLTPDGTTLVSESNDSTLLLWDIETGEPKGKPLAHTDTIKTIAISPDSKTLASGSEYYTIRLWDLDTCEPKGQPLVGHTSTICSLVFSPNGKTLASVAYYYTVRLWDTDTGEPQMKLWVTPFGLPRTIAFAPDGRTLSARGGTNSTRHWRLEDGRATIIEIGSQKKDLTESVLLRPRPPIRFNMEECEPHEQGWVFIGEKRGFWFPEDFYMDNTSFGSLLPVGITLFGRFLVLHHPNIHILDISAFL